MAQRMECMDVQELGALCERSARTWSGRASPSWRGATGSSIPLFSSLLGRLFGDRHRHFRIGRLRQGTSAGPLFGPARPAPRRQSGPAFAGASPCPFSHGGPAFDSAGAKSPRSQGGPASARAAALPQTHGGPPRLVGSSGSGVHTKSGCIQSGPAPSTTPAHSHGGPPMSSGPSGVHSYEPRVHGGPCSLFSSAPGGAANPEAGSPDA